VLECWINKSLGHLSCAVGSEIKKNDAIAWLNDAIRRKKLRGDKFIGGVVFVSISERAAPRCVLDGRIIDSTQKIIGGFGALPIFITVHGIKPSWMLAMVPQPTFIQNCSSRSRYVAADVGGVSRPSRNA